MILNHMIQCFISLERCVTSKHKIRTWENIRCRFFCFCFLFNVQYSYQVGIIGFIYWFKRNIWNLWHSNLKLQKGREACLTMDYQTRSHKLFCVYIYVYELQWSGCNSDEWYFMSSPVWTCTSTLLSSLPEGTDQV